MHDNIYIQDYFGQYCNHDYLTRLLVGHITKKKICLKYSVNSLL